MKYNSIHEDLQQRIMELDLEIERLRQVEVALIESEYLSKQYLDLPGVLYLALDKEGDITLINENCLEILGYRQEELLGKNWFKTCLPDELQSEVLDVYHQLMRGEIEPVARYENLILRKDGSKRVIAWNNTVLQNRSGEIVGTLSSGEDITERKQLEEELKESEEKYRKIFNNEIDAISLFDIETRKFLDVNDAFLKLYGYSREEVLQLAVDDLSAEPEKSKEAIKKSAIKGDTLIPRRLHKKKDGSEITVELSVGPFMWQGRKVMFAIVRDISPSIKAIESLSESEERYKTLYEIATDGIFILDMKGNFLDVNSTAHERLGYKKEEMLAMHITELDPPEFAAKVPERLGQIKKHGKAVFESAHIRKDGSIMPVEINSKILTLKGEEIFFSVIRDISIRKQLEEEFLKIQKLESTGVLAGGIAHDFNNILTAIIGNISIAKMFAGSNEKVLKRLIEAEKASMRAQNLSHQLLTFSKGGEPIKKSTRISELLKDSTSFSLTGSNVKCNLLMADKLWPANIDEGQISQVIQNVIKNADQAMPDGGTITLQAENKTISSKDVLPLKKGKYVWIVIKDQGGGIPKKHIAKIFDPYFTTKQEGSGLGLAASFSIIKKHAGFISAESEPGEGATFHIYLPASEKVPSVKKQAKEKLLQSGEKILVMDDDLEILKIASQMLDIMGFKTETATNGQEAVALYKKALKDGRPFGAVLLDLTIPGGMGGKETVKQLAHIDPEVKAIVTSGYANDPIMADYKSFGFSNIVNKPYNIEELSGALRDLFD